jgi:hypothetical protein
VNGEESPAACGGVPLLTQTARLQLIDRVENLDRVKDIHGWTNQIHRLLKPVKITKTSTK